jgi:hypothetical protein
VKSSSSARKMRMAATKKSLLDRLLRRKDPLLVGNEGALTGQLTGDPYGDDDGIDRDAHGNERNCSIEMLQKLMGEDVFVDQGQIDPVVSVVRDAWLKTARSVGPTSPGKRDEARDLVKKLYVARGWNPPADARVVYSPSPFTTMVTAGLLTSYWSSKKTIRTVGRGLTEEAQLTKIRKLAPKEMCNDVSLHVYSPVDAACRKLGLMTSCSSEVAIDLMAAVISSEDKMLDALEASVQSPMVLESVARIFRSCSEDDVADFRPSIVVQELGLRDTIDLMGKTLDVLDGGNLSSGIPAFVDCLNQKRISVDAELVLRSQIASLVGPWVMHPMFCILGELPDRLAVSSSGQLHSEEGPACCWSDDTRIYCLGGVRVGSRFVEDPESTTVTHLEKMTTQQRAACFDKAPKREQVMFAIHEMEDEED